MGLSLNIYECTDKRKEKKKTCSRGRVGVWVCGPDSADTCISGRDPLLRGATKVTLGQSSPGRCDSCGEDSVQEKLKIRENSIERDDYKRSFDLHKGTERLIILMTEEDK